MYGYLSHHALSLPYPESYQDYIAVIEELLQFDVGEQRVEHSITIIQDAFCEPNEGFFSNLALVSGVQPINLIRSRAEVIIDDDVEPECSKLWSNYPYGSYQDWMASVHAEDDVATSTMY